MKLTQVVAAIIIKDNKYFIAKRAKGKHLENMYEFPGGKLYTNETHEKGLKREIKEELDIEIDIIDKIGEENFSDNIIMLRFIIIFVLIKVGK